MTAVWLKSANDGYFSSRICFPVMEILKIG